MTTDGVNKALRLRWLRWHQSFGGSANKLIEAKIRQDFDFNYSEGYKSLSFKLTLQQEREGDCFRKLTLLFESHRHDKKDSYTPTGKDHYHYLTLDRCAVRIVLNRKNGKVTTRWVHMDYKKLEMSRIMPESIILATFSEPEFISEDELKDLGIDESVTTKNEFGEIEIYGRLQVYCYCTTLSCQGHKEIAAGFKNAFRQDLSLARRPQFFSKCASDCLTVSVKDADIKFVIESDPEKEVAAHSFILIASSPVFRKMLTVDMVEKTNGVITIADGSYGCLLWFLDLMHGRKMQNELLTITACNVIEILSLAHKYEVDHVTRICCKIIMSYDNEDLRVLDIQHMYHAGDLYNIPDLEYRAFQWMKWRRNTCDGYKVVTNCLAAFDEKFLRKCCIYSLKF